MAPTDFVASLKLHTLLPLANLHYAGIQIQSGPISEHPVYVIARFAVVFGINSMSNVEIIVQSAAEYNLLHYKCY